MKQNWMHEEIKGRRNSENANHHSVQNLLLSRSPSKNIKFKMERNLISPGVLYSVKRGLPH